MVNLELVDYLQGTFSFIFVLISLYIGLRIFSAYFKQKNKLFIFVGITWIGMALPWVPDSVSLWMAILLSQTISIELYIFIGNAFIFPTLVCWMYACTQLIFRERKQLIMVLRIIICFLLEVIFLTIFFIDVSLLGNVNPIRPFTAEFSLLLSIILVLVIFTILYTGLRLAQASLKAEDEDVKLKGKLLRAAFISFTIGALFDASLGMIFEDPTNPLLSILVIVIRILLIFSALEFYGGFILPGWMKKLLKKKS